MQWFIYTLEPPDTEGDVQQAGPADAVPRRSRWSLWGTAQLTVAFYHSLMARQDLSEKDLTAPRIVFDRTSYKSEGLG